MNISSENKKNKKLAYIEGWLSVIWNVILFGLKYWAGIVTGSIAIIADAWHTLSDSISSVIVLVAVKISSKKADKEHPFGHGRAELIASIIIGVLLAMIAFNFILEGISKLREHEQVTYGNIAIIVTVISIVVKEALAQYALWASRKTKSKALKADGWHHRTDAISSVIILIGIFLGSYFWWIDGVLSIFVALLIFYATYEILKDSIDPLIGEVPDKEVESQIKEIAYKVSGFDTDIHHIHIHKYGHHTELTFHIRFPTEMSFDTVHTITTDIENKIKDELNIYSTIHMEPKDFCIMK